MNLLNPHTIVLMTGLLAGMLAMVLLIMRRSYPSTIRGFGEWASAVLLFFITGPLYAIGDPATESLRISIANTVLMSGIYLCYIGTQRFFGVTPKLARGWTLVTSVNLVLAWFALVDNSYSLRLAITSALQTYLFCMNAWLVYRHGMHTFPRIMLTCVLVKRRNPADHSLWRLTDQPANGQHTRHHRRSGLLRHDLPVHHAAVQHQHHPAGFRTSARRA
jgi:hypothetical protein